MIRSSLAALITILALHSISYAEIDLRGADRTHTAPGTGGYDAPFYPDGTYRDDVLSPDEFLGYVLGSKPASYAEIVGYAEYLASTLGYVELHEYARTYEGRRLIYLVVTSEENADRLGSIREDLAKLSDPRGVSDGDARQAIASSPAVAWMGYGIHGDELSSCDAALWLAYQLAAGTDEVSAGIRDNVITIIDPLQNADGRSRWLGMLEQYGGVVPSHDIQSMHHTGVWPQGRTNHYLFDINRDWFSLVHPETRGKTATILEWMPHYLLDCHEMGPTDTYLFSPPREPFNPYMAGYIHKWWKRVADDQGHAFDKYGWSYYTREWNEEFFPGYGSSWAIYLGGIGMLFEQAGVDGSSVKRPEGTILTYRETVHHQFVGSFSNLTTVADNREELLSDYYALKRANVRGKGSAFVLPPSDNVSRMERFAETLSLQHIEVERADESFRVGSADSHTGARVGSTTFPEGSLVIRTNQPLKQLIDVILTFDIRIPTSFLETERKELLKHHSSRLYDTTGWSLPHAYGLEAYHLQNAPRVKTSPYQPAEPGGGITGDETMIGYVFDCTDDRAYLLLAALLERDIKVWSARSPFTSDGNDYARGSFLVRLNGNPDLDVDELHELAREAGVDVHGASTSLGGAGADLGGNEFRLLEKPRIAIVGGSPIAYYNFGSVWHLLDARLQMRTSTLDVSRLANYDLNKYNVIVLPHNWGGAMNYKQQLGDAGIDKLSDWVKDGGTLIAEGSASAFLADSSVAISNVRQRRQSLDKLNVYQDALEFARDAEAGAVDSLGVWQPSGANDEKEATKAEATTPPDDSERLAQEDERARRLYPRGAVLATVVDDEHWLTSGCGPMIPVLFNTDVAYLARGNVEVAARLAPANDVRLAGLMWPEARARWTDTAYATRESSGRGQVILFATQPNFRGYFYASERLLLNALLLGPGMGTRHSIEW